MSMPRQCGSIIQGSQVFLFNQYLRLAAALGARTSGAAAGDGVTAAAATAAAAAADGAAAPSQLHGMAGNLYPVFVRDR